MRDKQDTYLPLKPSFVRNVHLSNTRRSNRNTQPNDRTPKYKNLSNLYGDNRNVNRNGYLKRLRMIIGWKTAKQHYKLNSRAIPQKDGFVIKLYAPDKSYLFPNHCSLALFFSVYFKLPFYI